MKQLRVILLLVSSLVTGSALSNPAPHQVTHVYCPTTDEMALTMCPSNGAYNQSQLDFPRCLIIEKGKTYTFSSGLRWELTSVSPSLSHPIAFSAAYVNQQETHCLYKSSIGTQYVRIGLDRPPAVLPATIGNWTVNIANRQQRYNKKDTFDPERNYFCLSKTGFKVTDCPFIIKK